MKFYADKELLFEVEPYLVDAMAFFETREMSEKRFERSVRATLEAQKKYALDRFKKFFAGKVEPIEDEIAFVAKVKELGLYKEFDQKVQEATEKARQKQAEALAQKEPIDKV